MKPPVLFFIAFVLAAADGAYAKKKQPNISGAQTDTHISGTNTPHGNDNDKIHASGTTTPANSETSPAKKAERNAPGEARKPSQPKQPTVEKPRSPNPPRTPDIPRDK